MPFLLCCKESSPVVINNFFFFFIQGPLQMSGPIKHNTTGLWVKKKKNTAQRAEEKSGLMNIHVAIGLGVRCLRELWAVAKWFVWQETAKKKKKSKQSFSFLPLQFPKCQCHRLKGYGSVCPQVTPKIPTSTPFPLLFFPSVSTFWQKSVVCEVVLSRMANKQSHLRTGQSTLQHFKHLFQLTACLTSAG